MIAGLSIFAAGLGLGLAAGLGIALWVGLNAYNDIRDGRSRPTLRLQAQQDAPP